jgi:quercetin dioxygenase-like cupin family protein
MDIKRAGAEPSAKGPAGWFTGTVRIDPLFGPPEPARVGGAMVTFEPGARRSRSAAGMAHAQAAVSPDARNPPSAASTWPVM